MKLVALLSSIAFLVSACGAPQRPVVFTTSAKVETGVDSVSRALAAAGQTPTHVDRTANIVQTEWKDTGFLYGQIQGVTASVVRRYTVTLAPTTDGSDVTVRVDLKRCQQGGYSVGLTEIRGACEEMSLVPPNMQDDLNAVGEKVRGALGATPAPRPAPTAQPPAKS